MRTFGSTLLWITVTVIVILFLAPSIVIAGASFNGTATLAFPPSDLSLRWYGEFFSDAWIPATLTSLRVATGATAIATVLGVLGAFSVARGRYPGKSLVQALLLAPMMVPTVILGVGLFQIFMRWGIDGTELGMILAHSILGLPFVVITTSASLQTLNPLYDRAAAGLGASPIRRFLAITLPLIGPGVVTGALFAFITSLDEVAIAVFLTSPAVETLPVQIYTSLQNALEPTVAAISTVLLIVMFLLVILPNLLRRRSAA